MLQSTGSQSQMRLSDSTTTITKHSNDSLDDILTTKLTLGFEMMGELCCFCSTLSDFSKMSAFFQYINFNKLFLLNVMNNDKKESVQFSSVAQSCPTLRPHELQHARPPCPSPTPGVHPNPRPSSW